MRISLLVFAAILLLVFASDLFAVFPSRPVLDPAETSLPARNFVETPRLLPDGQRYMAGATETIVVILVEFPADTVDEETTLVADTCAAVTFDAAHDSAFYDGKIFSEAVGSNSMDQYWDECSLGLMDITGIVLGPYTMPHSMKYYGWDSPGVGDDGWVDDSGTTDGQVCANGFLSGTCRLIQDAVVAADPDIDYCTYDVNADGSIDHVMVVHAGQGQEGSNVPGYAIWSYFYWGLPYGPYDVDEEDCPIGVSLSSGLIVPEYYSDTSIFPLGTFCHEFSHSIGNPDLYDPSAGAANAPDNDDYPVSDWCLMDHGSWCGPTGEAESPSHLLGWNKVGTLWTAVTVILPTPDTTTIDVYDLETSLPVQQGANAAQVFKIKNPNGADDFWYIENRHPREAGTYFDKYDSDWSDWTNHGGPDSLDCGLVITHIQSENTHFINLTNDAVDGYDYLTNPAAGCPDSPWPYEVWVEDPGYDDRQAADYDEWWYPWEVKAGAAYADSSADDPHYLFDQTMHLNANCTRTASSIDGFGNKITNVYVEATSDCGSKMTARVFVPGWVAVIPVPDPPHFCHEWSCLHHDITSGGWTFDGPFPVIDASIDQRLQLAWSATGATTGRSSPVMTNTSFTVPPGEVKQGMAIVASSSGVVYCYSAEDGELVWDTSIGGVLRATPVAIDTLYGRGGVSVVLNRVYVNTTSRQVYYLNLYTGAVEGVWTSPSTGSLESAPRVGMVENPYNAGEFSPVLFVGSTDGTMYALDAAGPTTKWEYPTGVGINCPASMGRIVMPTAQQEKMLGAPQAPADDEYRTDVVFWGDAQGNIRCCMAYNGYTMWARDIGTQVLASPAVCDSVFQGAGVWQLDETVVAATGDGKVVALDACTGNELWEYDTGSTASITSSPSVAVDRANDWGMIWVESGNGTVYCLELGYPHGESRLIWSYDVGAGGTASSPAVALPYGMLPMSFDPMGRPIYPPEGATGDPERDGVVYLGCGGGGGGGRILALDAADGTLLWYFDTPSLSNASPGLAMGKVFFSADRLYAFEPNADAGVRPEVPTGVSLDLKLGPNPVTAGALIEYAVPSDSPVRLKVYDVRGRVVKSLFDGRRTAGVYSVEWAGRSQSGDDVASGIYFIRLEVGKEHLSQKMVYIR
jgi:M6 family metalloprotease-like protein